MIAGEGEDAKSVGRPPQRRPQAERADWRSAAAGRRAEAAARRSAAASCRTAAAVAATRPPAPDGRSGTRIFASPLARRIAKEAGLDLGAIAGSGPHGRIVERDVEAAMAGGAAKAAPGRRRRPRRCRRAEGSGRRAGAVGRAVRKLFEPGSFEEVPHDGMRKTIARRLAEAKQTIPHFYLTVDCEIDALLALREQINAAAPKDKDGKPAYKVSVNDMVIKALALALMRVPDANVTWTEGAMLKHKHADVGVAVSIPGGLITPDHPQGRDKTLSAISNEMKDFAARARARKLKPEEYQGGTSAVSNLGMFGIKNFAAVINPPHATILAVGAGEQRVVREAASVGGGDGHERHALDRPPRRRRRARRRADRRVQAADRKPDGDAGLGIPRSAIQPAGSSGCHLLRPEQADACSSRGRPDGSSMADSYDVIIIGGGPGRLRRRHPRGAARPQDGGRGARASRRHLPQLGLHSHQGAAAVGRDLPLPAASQGLRAEARGHDDGFDTAAVVKRSRGVSAQLNGGVGFLLKKNKVDVIWGEAVIAKPGEVKVGASTKPRCSPPTPRPRARSGAGTYQAKHIIIATGARPRVLPGIEPDKKLIWTYFEAMVPEAMPKSLIVMGSGAIGIEFASFYRTMGAEVTVVEVLPQILPVEDAEIAAPRPQALREAGHQDPDRRQGDQGREGRQRRHSAIVDGKGGKTQTIDGRAR